MHSLELLEIDKRSFAGVIVFFRVCENSEMRVGTY
jgi:hypothetical protein